jgi:hypothetical protein
MMTPQEFVRRWGSEDLERFAPATLESINLTDEAKQFLVEAGLPRRAPFPGGGWTGWPPQEQSLYKGFTLLPPVNPPQAQDGCEEFDLLEAVRQFRLLAVTPYRLFIAIDQKRHGRIVRHAEDGLRTGRSYFMNSSIPQLAESLLVYRNYSQRCQEWETEMQHRPNPEWMLRPQSFVDSVVQEIGRIDPEAMAYTIGCHGERQGGYWAVNTDDYAF